MCASQDANTRIFLYADDAKIYKVINQLSDQANLQVTLNTVKNWSDEWLLRLNIDKCKMVSYYRKKSFDTQYHILHDDKINILEKFDVDVDVVDLRAQAGASMPASNNNVKLYNISNF